MNWKRELKVGDMFFHENKNYYAIIVGLDSTQIKWNWYPLDGSVTYAYTMFLNEFYDSNFLLQMTDLDKALL